MHSVCPVFSYTTQTYTHEGIISVIRQKSNSASPAASSIPFLGRTMATKKEENPKTLEL